MNFEFADMNEHVESYVGTGTDDGVDGSTKRIDHGASPAKPAAKRTKVESLDQSNRITSKQSTSLHEDRCCSCTKLSTCKTRKCECVTAKRPCTSCDCFHKCSNTSDHKQPYCKIVTAVPEIDESQAPAAATTPTVANSETDDKSSEEAERESVEADESRRTPVGEEEEERNVGDLPGATIAAADRLLDTVYGDYVHQNSDQHLDGGIADDALWQNYWRL